MKTAPTNTDDIIDSRAVIERIEELEGERAPLADTFAEKREAFESKVGKTHADASADDIDNAAANYEEGAMLDAENPLIEWDIDNGEELAALKALQDQAEGYCSDWAHGAQLIRDSYFTDYAQQYADDIGAIRFVDRNVSWPMTCIDWEAAANELQSDYTSVEFDGVTYWVR